MSLKSNFYSEIFEKESEWIELINKGLLNTIYINYVLKPFYEMKINELKEEYIKTKNNILGQILSILNNILVLINSLDNEYKTTGKASINKLSSEFLISKMSIRTQYVSNKKTTKM